MEGAARSMRAGLPPGGLGVRACVCSGVHRAASVRGRPPRTPLCWCCIAPSSKAARASSAAVTVALPGGRPRRSRAGSSPDRPTVRAVPGLRLRAVARSSPRSIVGRLPAEHVQRVVRGPLRRTQGDARRPPCGAEIVGQLPHAMDVPRAPGGGAQRDERFEVFEDMTDGAARGGRRVSRLAQDRGRILWISRHVSHLGDLVRFAKERPLGPS